MFRIENNNLVLVDSLPRFRADSSEAEKLIRVNDTLLVIQYSEYKMVGGYSSSVQSIAPSYLSSEGFITLSDCIISSPVSCLFYTHGTYDKKIFVSADYSSSSGTYFRSNHALFIYDLAQNRTIALTTRESNQLLPGLGHTNAYNTGYYLSQDENICTNRLDLHSQPMPVPTELFVSDVRNPYSHWYDSLNNAIYRDTVHKQNQLLNILLDSLNKHVFLIFDNNLTVLGYNYATVGIANRLDKLQPSGKYLIVLSSPFSRGVTVILPFTRRPADLFFYSLSGRLVDKMAGVTSNAVLWRPKTLTKGCYFVVVKSGKERFVERFIVR